MQASFRCPLKTERERADSCSQRLLLQNVGQERQIAILAHKFLPTPVLERLVPPLASRHHSGRPYPDEISRVPQGSSLPSAPSFSCSSALQSRARREILRIGSCSG